MPPSEARATVSIVIPTWQRRDLVLRLLDLLEAQTRPPDEVIVVDNGSTDGTAEAVGERATVIRLTENFGFARAVNLGIHSARGHWIGILNNDVEPRRDWLEILQKSDSDFVTGKLLNLSRPELLDGTFDLISRALMPWRAGNGLPDVHHYNYNRSINFTSWTAVLHRRSVFDRIGVLDETFGSYYEDVDFGVRCAIAGIRGEYRPEAVALHAGSATLGAWRPATVRLLTRNHRLLVRKYLGLTPDAPTRRRILLSQILWGILATRHGQWKAWWKGHTEDLPSLELLPGRERLAEILDQSEAELYRLQKEAGFDWYWRMYFRLFPR